MALIDLSPDRKVAVHKAVSEDLFKQAREQLAPGEYLVDLAVRVAGSFKVSDPFVQSFALSFPWQKLALKLATRVPRHVLNVVMREIRAEEPLDELKDHVNALWAEINAGSEKTATKVTQKLTVEVLPRG